jgi:hypothetical protein
VVVGEREWLVYDGGQIHPDEATRMRLREEVREVPRVGQSVGVVQVHAMIVLDMKNMDDVDDGRDERVLRMDH